jgi:hypothetical protein
LPAGAIKDGAELDADFLYIPYDFPTSVDAFNKGSKYTNLPTVICSTKRYKELRSEFQYVRLIEGLKLRDSLEPGRAPRLVCLPGRSPDSPTR